MKAKAAATSEQPVNGCMEGDNINRHPRVAPKMHTPGYNYCDCNRYGLTQPKQCWEYTPTVARIEKPKSVALSANSNQSVPRCPTRKKKATHTPETDSYPIHSGHAPDNNPQYLDEKRATLQAWDLELKSM